MAHIGVVWCDSLLISFRMADDIFFCQTVLSTKRKIKATKARLTTLQKIKSSFVKGTPMFNKTSREQQKGAFFVVTYKHSARLFYCAYDFEHQHLDVQSKHLKSRLVQLNFKKDCYEKQWIQLSNKVSGVCFGSKKLARGRKIGQRRVMVR
jgi:hypothetical protein